MAADGATHPSEGAGTGLKLPQQALQTLTAMLPQHALGAPAVSMLLRARHRALTVGLVQLTWTRVLPRLVLIVVRTHTH